MSKDKKMALVTGGSRGIGRAVCIELARAGYHVIVNYASNSAAAEETVSSCEEAGGSAEYCGFDVSNSEEVSRAFSELKSAHGSLAVLVNNAGIAKDGLLLRLKDQDWDRTLDVNLKGAFLCSREAAKLMVKARNGSIVNISSVVAEMGNPGQAPYCASKAGLIGLTRSMARELASRGITVNAITPGFIKTDMTDALGESLKEEHLKAIPLGRYGEPREVASLVRFLCSGDARYITGQVIGINGGMYM
ncbi:MAG: 3-oxoacyl-[acyl-carrier-protein] reductase [Candidatus Dadabacteria bacterium]|nr:MAG: 3-oxoacyl-[acyl-carrier-protein] reductase [Candidatus Dadabacteria bacterium]